MEGTAFDRLTMAVSRAGSRRRLLGALVSVGLGGLLSHLDDDAADARRKRHGRQNSHRPGKHKDNRRGKRKKKGKNDLGSQCGATNSDCTQDSDCCSSNCFDFSCADKAHTCGPDGADKRCLPPAKGCSGDTCCYGSIACDVCCEPGITQCNPQGECCPSDCAGRQCGDDGCGAGGTCGTCPTGQTCNDSTGQCQGGPTCIGLLQPCDTSDQCCAADRTTCGDNSEGEKACCRTLGEACTASGGECCMVIVDEGQDQAHCSPQGACGGTGAACRFNEACLSGVCCGAVHGGFGTCGSPQGC
jgi:hypothetical protein